MEKLYTKAMLCKISISIFNPKRSDAKTTREVLTEKKASSEAGAWIKNLINPNSLDKIISISQQARIKNYNLSLPWQDEGWRILPIELFTDYQSEMHNAKIKFQNEVENFLSLYPSLIEEARENLKDMFNLKDYPSVESIKEKFDFKIDFLPIPSSQDFRIGLNAEELEQIKNDTDNLVKQAENNAIKNLWERIANPIKNISEKLSQDDSIFRDSLIDNLKEILKTANKLNLSDNPNIKKIISECNKKLTSFEPQELRENKETRKKVLKDADDLLKKMSHFI